MTNTDPQVGVVAPRPADNNTDKIPKVNTLRIRPSQGGTRLGALPRQIRRATIKCLTWALDHLDERSDPARQDLRKSSLTADADARSNYEAMRRCFEAGGSWQDTLDQGTEDLGGHHVK